MARRWATLEQAAEAVQCHPNTLRCRIADGSLRAYTMPGGNKIRVDLDDVDAMIEDHPIPSATMPPARRRRRPDAHV